jgi:hypothetical protein
MLLQGIGRLTMYLRLTIPDWDQLGRDAAAHPSPVLGRPHPVP